MATSGINGQTGERQKGGLRLALVRGVLGEQRKKSSGTIECRGMAMTNGENPGDRKKDRKCQNKHTELEIDKSTSFLSRAPSSILHYLPFMKLFDLIKCESDRPCR